MIQMYDFLECLMKEVEPFLILAITMTILSTSFRIVKRIIQDYCSKEYLRRFSSGQEEKTKNIDKDLQKYFNYKE